LRTAARLVRAGMAGPRYRWETRRWCRARWDQRGRAGHPVRTGRKLGPP
jgi:hypothetical protein